MDARARRGGGKRLAGRAFSARARKTVRAALTGRPALPYGVRQS